MRIGIFRRPGGGFVSSVWVVWRGRGGRYFSHADPGLGDVDEEAVLGPFSGALGFFEGEVCAVLLEVDLYDEGYAVGSSVSFLEPRTKISRCW